MQKSCFFGYGFFILPYTDYYQTIIKAISRLQGYLKSGLNINFTVVLPYYDKRKSFNSWIKIRSITLRSWKLSQFL